MENGVPNHLKSYISIIKAPKDIKRKFNITGNFKCTCGNETFHVIREEWVQTLESKEAEKCIEKLYEKHRKEYSQKSGTLCETGTEDGKWCIAHITYVGGEKIKILEDITELRNIINSTPLVPIIFESVCAQCNQNLLLFDSRKHGYNGLINTKIENYMKDFKTIKKSKCRKCGNETSKITVTISSTGKDDLFNEDSDLINENNWEDAFDWITIDLKCGGCHKDTKKYLNLETM